MKALALVTTLIAMPTLAAELRVEVENLTGRSGQIAYALFDNKKGFPSEKEHALRKDFARFDLKEGESVARFSINDVKAGEYALVIFEDLNGDGALNKNFLGIPREPAGASNNPKYRFGPPNYDESKFTVHEEIHPLNVRMVK
ncbi:MAG TPA: DUF2141 domain-containing protein [Bdellovibrionota bacterium]|jgi:uncharacterized protein (DUF2141 family)|nr:DUF2141 domain-containing protein [Bdellovibrionota bacterium]